MKKINVIDLDKTLIPFDSFHNYVLEKIKSGNSKVLIFSVMRKLRLLSASEFKKRVVLETDLFNNSKDIKIIIYNILGSINRQTLDMIRGNSDKDTINVLCSASPEVYVKKVAEYFGWVGFGSFFYGKKFYHMWGENKIRYIKEKYPLSEYVYNFAISDSESDRDLLKMFKSWKMFK